MANIFSNFGNKLGNAFTNLGQGGHLFNADPAQIAALSNEDKERFKQQGLQRLADSFMVAGAIGSGDAQRIALAQNQVRQRKVEEKNAEQKRQMQETFANNPELLKIYNTFGKGAAFQESQRLRNAEINAAQQKRQEEGLKEAGFSDREINLFFNAGMKADDILALRDQGFSGQNIIDEINNTVQQESVESGTQNDYANLDQAFGPVDTAQEVLLNKPFRTLFGADPASDTAAAIRDKESLNLEILATLANDYEGRPNILLLKEIKKNIPEGSLTSEADAYQRYSNFLNRTKTRINYLEQGMLSNTVSDATKEKYRIELVKAKTLEIKLNAATDSLAPNDNVSLEPNKNFVSEGKYNYRFINEGN
jgi:hypothetical protein